MYAPDEMMKVMKEKQKSQICNYDTHNTFLIEIGLSHLLQPKHVNHQGECSLFFHNNLYLLLTYILILIMVLTSLRK